MTIDVIILSESINNELIKMTTECINSLRQSETHIKFNVILIESNKQIDPLIYSDIIDHLYIPDEEFNYNKFCNIGLSFCTNEYVCLCNNDLIFQPNWCTEILKIQNQHTYISSFSPWNSFERWHESRMSEYKEFYVGDGIGYEMCGWCIFTKKDTFDLITLDDRVSFWFSDNVYGDELRKHNIKHALVTNSIVNHLTSKTLLTKSEMEIKKLTEGQIENYNKQSEGVL